MGFKEESELKIRNVEICQILKKKIFLVSK